MIRLVYKIQNQNISTFEDNVKFMGDLPFSIYFDLETTCEKKIYEFEEAAKMYSISYAFFVAFNPCLNLNGIFAERSFNHTFEQLNYISYLFNKKLKFLDPVTAIKLETALRQSLIKMKDIH